MTTERALKPLPPRGITLTDTSGSGGGLLIEWANRNRLNRTIFKQTDPTDTLEPGQTHTISIYTEADVLLHTETGLTGTSFTYDDADEIADAGDLQTVLNIRIKAVRDGYESREALVVLDREDRVVVGSFKVVHTGDRVVVS